MTEMSAADRTSSAARTVSDGTLAVDLARRTGELLVRLRTDETTRTGADRQADEFVAGELSAARSSDAVLSEEIGSRGDREHAERVWIVDPLDGTREYREVGRDDWAVHVALWKGGALSVGAVALPALGVVLSTEDPVPSVPEQRGIRRVAVSRTRPPAWAVAVAEELGAELVAMGSAGAKAAAVIRGEVDAYLHDGGQYEWDSAAPVAVARRYGLVACRADGSPLRYNRRDPYLPDLVICPAQHAQDLLDRIARHRAPGSLGDVVSDSAAALGTASQEVSQ